LVVEFDPGTVPGFEFGFWGFGLEVLLGEPDPAPGDCGVVCGVDVLGAAGEPCASEFGLELCPAEALPVAGTA
jgi:hypothetical protein